MSVIIGVSFTKETCCTCGVIYALEDSYRARLLELKESGNTYCPNGHKLHFRGRSLENQLDDLKLKVQQRDNDLSLERIKRERLERRIRKGVCLYCKRTFGNLASHMAHKHKAKA